MKSKKKWGQLGPMIGLSMLAGVLVLPPPGLAKGKPGGGNSGGGDTPVPTNLFSCRASALRVTGGLIDFLGLNSGTTAGGFEPYVANDLDDPCVSEAAYFLSLDVPSLATSANVLWASTINSAQTPVQSTARTVGVNLLGLVEADVLEASAWLYTGIQDGEKVCKLTGDSQVALLTVNSSLLRLGWDGYSLGKQATAIEILDENTVVKLSVDLSIIPGLKKYDLLILHLNETIPGTRKLTQRALWAEVDLDVVDDLVGTVHALLGTLNTTQTTLNTTLLSLNSQVDSLTQQLLDAQNLLAIKETELLDLNAQLNLCVLDLLCIDLNLQLNVLLNEIASLNSLIASLTGQVSELEGQIADITAQIALNDTEIGALDQVLTLVGNIVDLDDVVISEAIADYNLTADGQDPCGDKPEYPDDPEDPGDDPEDPNDPNLATRMTGGGSIGDSGVRHGFELHCDAGQTPNRLEINWENGQRFHLDSLTSSLCSATDGIDAGKPNDNVFNTIEFEGDGTGKVGKTTGSYHVKGKFTDAGEPGKDADYAYIEISTVSKRQGEVIVKTAEGLLNSGNHQAHK